MTPDRLRHGIVQMRALMAIAAPESVVWFNMRAGIAWARTELARLDASCSVVRPRKLKMPHVADSPSDLVERWNDAQAKGSP